MVKTLICSAVAVAGLVLLMSCATEPRTELVQGKNATECVILLHGLNRSWRAMNVMAEALQEEGYTTANVDYPSQTGPIETIAPLAVGAGVAECRATGATRIHFVTHSIGGILLRYQQTHDPIPELGRVVMLAPPNQGSEVIDRTRNWPGAELFGGEAALQLGTDEGSVPSQLGPVDFELGVIAGSNTMNPWMSAMLPNPDDGKVSAARTQVDGMDDFLIVDRNHHFITKGEDVIRNAKSFLKSGTFVGL
jgi:triacylglycerol esterase/lipase EstA (alpha/beta hydrolase family)